MRLTTKGRYAVTAMLDLALHKNQRPVSLADISQRQAISLSYLEQLFAKLRKNSLVSSVRGPGGGYMLQCDSKEISIAIIIDAVDESMDSTNCQGAGDCQDGETCLTHYLWEGLSDQIHGFLEGISLADLVLKNEVKQIAEQQDRKQLIVNDKLHEIGDANDLEAPISSL
ncbi:MAG: Fe-S cluster assembly transcriptional regulator IscR [Gammaproteobacteria bacterium]|nr:Fe-S cluster assembly transcriptional regulator IscR [Gammaproteobacteria bacterium]HJN95181.1 Fe-S cluster assembly transcriptional regulator IscR [Gammaproteobacteria bacterium]|tara:strand:+ start:16094 stop:16603 length:510 start_codon:yes stop_codon:yes gene_type:complete